MIRSARVEDIPNISNLGNYLNYNFKKTYNLNSYITDKNYIILVNEDERINGFIIIYKNIDYFEVEAIAVELNNREKGIASNLLNYFLDNYTQKNTSIILEVAVNNEKAVRLYTKFGFKIIHTRKKYYNQIDAYVMKKVI